MDVEGVCIGWIGSESTCPQCFSQQACRKPAMLNIMLVVLTMVLIYQNLPGLCTLQSGPWLNLCSWPGRSLPSCLWGRVEFHWHLSAVLRYSCEVYYRAQAHINIRHCTGGSPWVLPIEIWSPRTYMEIKGIVYHLLWRPGIVCAPNLWLFLHVRHAVSQFLHELQRRQTVHNHRKLKHTVFYL